MPLTFDFHLEYTKRGCFGVKLGYVWYCLFDYQPAKISKGQEKQFIDYLYTLNESKDTDGMPFFLFGDDTNTLYLGFLRLWWTQRHPVSKERFEMYCFEYRKKLLKHKEDTSDKRGWRDI